MLDGDDLLRLEHVPVAEARAAAVRPARRRAQDRGVRAAVLLRACTTSRWTRTSPASGRGWACSGRAQRFEELHDDAARAAAPGRGARVPRQPAAPRPADVPRAAAAVRRPARCSGRARGSASVSDARRGELAPRRGHRRVGDHVRDGPGRGGRAAGPDLPRLPLPRRRRARGRDLPALAAAPVAGRLRAAGGHGRLPDRGLRAADVRAPAHDGVQRGVPDRAVHAGHAAARVDGAADTAVAHRRRGGRAGHGRGGAAVRRRGATCTRSATACLSGARSRSPCTSWRPTAGCAGHDVGALLAVQLAVCGGACLLAAAIGGDLAAPAGGDVWSALAVTAVLASAGGFFAQSYAQQHASPARTALILALEPAFAGLFGWLLAGDHLSASNWAGAVLILIAILAVDLVPRLPSAAALAGGVTWLRSGRRARPSPFACRTSFLPAHSACSATFDRAGPPDRIAWVTGRGPRIAPAAGVARSLTRDPTPPAQHRTPRRGRLPSREPTLYNLSDQD